MEEQIHDSRKQGSHPQACVRPIATYAAETKAETAKTKSMLRVMDMRTLRSILGINITDHIPNRSIRRLVEI